MNKNFKIALTMSEVLIVLTVLGVIAAIIITTVKPASKDAKKYAFQAQKVLAEIDDATSRILQNHSPEGKMSKLYKLDTEQIFVIEGSQINYQELVKLYKKYLATRRTNNYAYDSKACMSEAPSVNGITLNLKNGACFILIQGKTINNVSSTTSGCNVNYVRNKSVDVLYPGDTEKVHVCADGILGMIQLDINSLQGPNQDGLDRFYLPFSDNGIEYDPNSYEACSTYSESGRVGWMCSSVASSTYGQCTTVAANQSCPSGYPSTGSNAVCYYASGNNCLTKKVCCKS